MLLMSLRIWRLAVDALYLRIDVTASLEAMFASLALSNLTLNSEVVILSEVEFESWPAGVDFHLNWISADLEKSESALNHLVILLQDTEESNMQVLLTDIESLLE